MGWDGMGWDGTGDGERDEQESLATQNGRTSKKERGTTSVKENGNRGGAIAHSN